MSRLIQQLKMQHGEIVNMLDQVKQVGITTVDGQNKLKKAKDMLLSHLAKEDREFYPAMTKMADKDPSVSQMVSFYSKDMKTISEQAICFFDTYEKGGNGLQFAQDYGKLMGVLSSRINKEETVLYKKFEDLS